MIRIGAILFVATLASTIGGCAQLDLENAALPWPPQKEREYGTPQRIIAVWADTVFQQPGKPPTRGFGGRIYFYDGDRKGIPVDGKLVIYAYDDTSPENSYDKPTRKYAFTAEQLTRYYSESDLGASYNIWVPWDEVGGVERQISLLPVFVDNSGQVVRGNFSKNRLPGRRMPSEEERRGFYVARKNARPQANQSEQMVRRAEYRQARRPHAGNGINEDESGLKTTTIRIPQSLAERMAASPPTLAAQRQRRQSDSANGARRRDRSVTETRRARGLSAGEHLLQNNDELNNNQSNSRSKTYYKRGTRRQNVIESGQRAGGSKVQNPRQTPQANSGQAAVRPRGQGESGVYRQGQTSANQFLRRPAGKQVGRNASAPTRSNDQTSLQNGQHAVSRPAAMASYQTASPPGNSSSPTQAVPLGKQGFIGADPGHSVSATSRAWARQHAESAHFEPPRFRAPAKPGAQRHLGREGIQQSPVAPRSHRP